MNKCMISPVTKCVILCQNWTVSKKHPGSEQKYKHTQAKPMKHDLSRNEQAQSVWHIK